MQDKLFSSSCASGSGSTEVASKGGGGIAADSNV